MHNRYESIIFDIIEKEKDRQTKGIELIASENFVSDAVLQAAGSVLTNKYAEGYPGKRYYGGCEFVDQIELLAIARLKQLFGATWANVQPHSGSQANAAVMSAILQPGDKILGFSLAHGGHLTHGSSVSFSGKLYQAISYGVRKDTETIDYEQMESLATKWQPKLIICGASAYSRDWDYKRIRTIADTVGAFVMADIAHTAGMIAKKILNDPFPYSHFITTTTHKTLRGPRGGAILMGSDFENPWKIKSTNGKYRSMSSLVDSAVFPGIQGGPLMHIIAAKAVAFEEALRDEFSAYILQVCKNAKTMADSFLKMGYRVVSGGTDNHLFLLDLSSKGITGARAEDVLEQAAITVNKNMIPFDPNPPNITSGIRIGAAAITTRGLVEKDMEHIADLINEILKDVGNLDKITKIRNQISNWLGEKPLFLFK